MLYIAPSKYISGYDNSKEFGIVLKKEAEKILIISDEKSIEAGKGFVDSLQSENIDYREILVDGFCSFENIELIRSKIKETGSDCVVGIGGGRIMDMVKAAGYDSGVKIVTIPTIAATCAAWSSHSAMYTDEGIALEYYSIKGNPNICYVDKKILFEAPVRYFKAGLADTLAKWIESEASTREIKEKNFETEAALIIARKIFDDIFENGEKALRDINEGLYSPIVDRLMDAVILGAGLVGGIGGEKCRAVAAHAVNNGFTILGERCWSNLHGEVVGLGILVQMIIDGKADEEIEKMRLLYKRLGIPCGLKDLGFDNITEDELDRVVRKAMYKGETIWNLPYDVTHDMLKTAIMRV